MTRSRPNFNARNILIGIIALGVYGIFFLIGIPEVGSIMAVVTLFGLCFLSCYLKGMRQKKKLDKIKAEPPPPDKEVLTPEKFKYCIRCNAAVDKSVTFCTNCGQPFEI